MNLPCKKVTYIYYKYTACVSSKLKHYFSLDFQNSKYLGKKNLNKGLIYVDIKARNKTNLQEIQSHKVKEIIILYLPKLLQKSWSTIFLSLVILAYHSSLAGFVADTEQNQHSLIILVIFSVVQFIWCIIILHFQVTCKYCV